MSPRRRQSEGEDTVGCLVLVAAILVFSVIIRIFQAIGDLYESNPVTIVIVGLIIAALGLPTIKWVMDYRKQKIEREREERYERARQWDEERRRKREQQEEERRREEQERAELIEAMLERDALSESIHYMDGAEFENFMANVLDKKGYHVQTTPASGDQGVDLLLTIDDRRVAVQLKRYTGPVGNAAIQAVVAGMFHYKAKEAWVITTSTFTKSARQLAKSNRVRLIDGKELKDWLSDLKEELG